MKIYKYNVIKVDGSLNDHSSLEELNKRLNQQGNKGYKLHTAIPQFNEDSTGATVLIFELEDKSDECILG